MKHFRYYCPAYGGTAKNAVAMKSHDYDGIGMAITAAAHFDQFNTVRPVVWPVWFVVLTPDGQESNCTIHREKHGTRRYFSIGEVIAL